MLLLIANVSATSSLRASAGFPKLAPRVIVAVGCGPAFYFLSLTLKKIGSGTAYASWSGVGKARIAIIGVVPFRESLNWVRTLGIALIIVGVVLLSLFGTPHA